MFCRSFVIALLYHRIACVRVDAGGEYEWKHQPTRGCDDFLGDHHGRPPQRYGAVRGWGLLRMVLTLCLLKRYKKRRDLEPRLFI